MKSTKVISSDLQIPGFPEVVHLKQYDANTRYITIPITDGGSSFTLPDNPVFMIGARLPDGSKVLYDKIINASAPIGVLVSVDPVKWTAKGITGATFTKTSSGWSKDGSAIDLDDFGVSITKGTPTTGANIIVSSQNAVNILNSGIEIGLAPSLSMVAGTGLIELYIGTNDELISVYCKELQIHEAAVDPYSAFTPQSVCTIIAQIQACVQAELTSHPEWTIIDGSVTRDKLSNSLINIANNIDQHMTNFVTPESTEYISATLADFDADYRTYEGVQVTSAGAVAASASYNTYAFVCPHDGFTFKTCAARIFVSSVYPEIGVTLPIKTIIANNNSDMTSVRTVANKGDIVILCNVKSKPRLYLTSPYGNVAKINNLKIADPFDTFKQNAVIDSGLSIIGNDKLDIQKAEGKLIVSTTGAISANASYDTYYFRVPVSELTVKCTNGFRACLSLTDPTLTAAVENLKQLLYSAPSGRVETFTAHLNDWVVISVGKTSGAIDLQTDYANRFSLPGLRLDWRQQNSFYRYVTESTVKRLYVYYKSGDKYVRWELHNAPSVNSNSDTWQIGAVYGYDESLITGVELVAAGEFELAFKEYGAAEYCGGNNHGDENTDDFTLMIDGKTVTLANLDNAYHAFNRIDAIEHATVNRCDTPDENILKHQKVWTFENGTVKVWQTLEFLEDLLCDFLCCMLAANRSAFQYGVRQGRVGTEVMTSTDYERVVTKGNEMMYLMYGANATAKVTARCADHTPEASLWINNAAALNKLYYNYFGQIPNTQVASGTVLKWESEYDIAYY